MRLPAFGFGRAGAHVDAGTRRAAALECLTSSPRIHGSRYASAPVCLLDLHDRQLAEKLLRRTGQLEPLQLTLSPPNGLMGVLRSVVGSLPAIAFRNKADRLKG
jgi:hypothetical protein